MKSKSYPVTSQSLRQSATAPAFGLIFHCRLFIHVFIQIVLMVSLYHNQMKMLHLEQNIMVNHVASVVNGRDENENLITNEIVTVGGTFP